MLARERLKLRNAEKSISFIQEQHAKTLEGLHQVIDKLQKKNARLTFQLTMNGRKSTDIDQINLEDELIASKSELAKVHTSLSKEKQTVSLLQHQVEELLSRHAEDITMRDDSIKQLNVELDSKANVIVLLTQQVYRLRAKFKQQSDSKLACSCPHFSMEQHRVSLHSQDRRLAPLDEKAHHSQNSVPPQYFSTNNLGMEPEFAVGRLTPTPPPSSPPHASTGRPHGITRRASTPVKRKSLSPKYHGQIQPDRTNAMYQQSLKQPASGVDEAACLPDEWHRVSSLHNLEREDKVFHKSMYRNGSAVLPPILSPNNEPVPSSITFQSGAADLSSLQNRHTTTYKSSGLNSAPPGSFRVLQHRIRQPRQKSGGVMREEESDGEAEGTLLVKESEQSVPHLCDTICQRNISS